MATTRARKSAAKKTATKKTAASKAGKVAKKTAGGTVASKRPAAKKAPVRKAVARKSSQSTSKTRKAVSKPGRKPADKTPTPVHATTAQSAGTAAKKQVRKTVGKQATAKRAVAGKSAAATRSPARKPAAGGAQKQRKITPRQALANTRALLEAKQQHDRQPQPWQTLDPHQEHVAQAGFQSPEAAAKAEELHAGESRMQAIQGSIGSQDRHNQGKRDKR